VKFPGTEPMKPIKMFFYGSRMTYFSVERINLQHQYTLHTTLQLHHTGTNAKLMVSKLQNAYRLIAKPGILSAPTQLTPC